MAVLYAGATAWVGRDGWRAAVENLSPTDLAVVLGLVLAGFLLRAGRWHYYMRAVGWNVPFFAGFSAFVASFALTATPGKAGELVKAVLLRERYPVSLSQGAGILFVERLGDLAAVALLAVSGLALFVGVAGYALAASAAMIVLGVVVSHPRLASAALERHRRRAAADAARADSHWRHFGAGRLGLRSRGLSRVDWPSRRGLAGSDIAFHLRAGDSGRRAFDATRRRRWR
jgi:uncharacterized protein (TIRG00374 family)